MLGSWKITFFDFWCDSVLLGSFIRLSFITSMVVQVYKDDLPKNATWHAVDASIATQDTKRRKASF